MTNPNAILDALRVRFGGSIPPAPRRGETAIERIWFNSTLLDHAHAAANTPANGYAGDVSALVRHATSMWLQVLAESSGADVSQVVFNMEVLRQKAEEADYIKFVNYTQAAVKDATEYASTVAGKRSAVDLLHGVVKTITKHPSKTVRLRMEAHLTGNREFVKLVQETGDELLKSWLEVAT